MASSSYRMRRSFTGTFPGARAFVISFAALTAALGCRKDHRISLDDFQRMEQATAPAPTATSDPETAASDVNRRLGPVTLGPGDVIQIQMFAGEDRQGLPPFRVRLDRDGAIDLPLVGSVRIADLQPEDAEDVITKAYVPAVYREANVYIEIVESRPTGVLVFGAVTQPGLVQLRRNERNLLHAIVAAGGISEAASGSATLRRVRNPSEQVTYDLTNPVQLRQALAIAPLENGDIVQMGAAQPNTVFVGGLVQRAAPQVYPPGSKITVLQALAAAGGLRTDVTPKEGTLVRRLSDGHDVHVKLDLPALARGEQANLTLAAGDILWVPATLETQVQDFINRNIFLRAGVSVNYNVSGVEYMNRHSQQNGTAAANSLYDSYDPLGFLNQNSLLQNINNRPQP